MSVQGRRGRKVVRNNRRSLNNFYMLVGGVLVILIGFGGFFALRGGTSREVTPVAAPIGRMPDGYYYKGNPEAAVKVVEYGDYQCPTCALYDQTMAPLIDQAYVDTGKILFVYHELPLTSLHPNAQISAEAARCAGDQGVDKFWKMHDMLFLNQDQWALLRSPQAVFSSYAGQLGLNRSTFEGCLSNGANTALVQAAQAAAFSAGLNSTPSFDVNGQIVDKDHLDSAITAALRAAGK